MTGLGFRIFIFICIYCCLPIVFLMLRNETKPKKNIILGATLPVQAQTNPKVLAICSQFRRQLTVIFVALTAVCLFGLAFRHTSLSLTFYLTWLIFAIVLPMFSYARANRKLRDLKHQAGWRSGWSGKTMVDLNAVSLPEKALKDWLFLPPVLLTLIPSIVTLATKRDLETAKYELIGYFSFTATILLFYLCYRFLYRRRAEAVDGNTDLTIALTKVRRYHWHRCWVWMSYLTGLFTLAMWLSAQRQTLFIGMTLAYLAAVLFLCIQVEFQTRKAQQTLTRQCSDSDYVDEDDYWIWGLFYDNPNDSHLIVNSRIGINTTVNLAKPAGKVLLWLSGLILLAMPFLGVWMIHEEMTPVQISLDETVLQVQQTGLEYEIPLGDIQKIELLDTLPACTKLVGSNFSTLYKGKFNLQGMGSANLCLDPTAGPYLFIDTGTALYLLGASQEGETARIYEVLTQEIS